MCSYEQNHVILSSDFLTLVVPRFQFLFFKQQSSILELSWDLFFIRANVIIESKMPVYGTEQCAVHGKIAKVGNCWSEIGKSGRVSRE